MAPALTPVDHPAMGALVRAIERGLGPPPLYTREGGSGPEEALGRVLDAPVLFLGVGLPGDRIHAPNERMVMDQFWKGLLAAGELLIELGGSLKVAGRPDRGCLTGARTPSGVPDSPRVGELRRPGGGAHLGVRRHLPAVPLAAASTGRAARGC